MLISDVPLSSYTFPDNSKKTMNDHIHRFFLFLLSFLTLRSATIGGAAPNGPPCQPLKRLDLNFAFFSLFYSAFYLFLSSSLISSLSRNSSIALFSLDTGIPTTL